MENQIILSPSPHLESGESTQRVMLDVIIAMVPACIATVFFFGMPAVIVMAACTIFCVAAEWACNKIMKQPTTICDYSAALTGLLLAFNLPPSAPIWMCFVGAIFAIPMAKVIFGGLGYNTFNPALVARTALLISFPAQMTDWRAPGGFVTSAADLKSMATPLGELGTSLMLTGKIPESFDLAAYFLGNQAGCVGAASSLALLLGAVYMFYRKVITWETPVSFIGAAMVLSGLLWMINPETNANPIFHLFTGGMILGAFFMATDMVTSPLSSKGMLIFGAGCGILTILIRVYASFPEGVAFAILLMNSAVPIIDRYTKPTVFGTSAQKA